MIRVSYFASLELFGDASVRNVAECYRRLVGKGIRREDVRVWLAKKSKRDTVGIHLEPGADTPSVLKTAVSGYSPDTVGIPSRAPHKVLDQEGAGDSGEPDGSPPSLLTLPLTTAKPRKPRQTALGLVVSHEQRANEILDLIWPFVSGVVSGSMSLTSWRSRNKIVARDLAAVGRSDADILAAHASVSNRFKGPVYTLKFVQDELLRLGSIQATDDEQPERELAVLDDFPQALGDMP